MTEHERLAALIELDLLDTPEEKEYDDLVRLASALCGTPISLVSLVDQDRQWFKAAHGLTARETHRDLSFCAHAIRQPDLFIVEDATKDPRFVDNALVTGDPHIRFYAGVPLEAPGGAAIGTLCVIDTVPRQLNPDQREALSILGAQVKARMELRLKQKLLLQKQQELGRSLEENEKLCSSLTATNNLFVSFMNHGPFASYIKNAAGDMLFYNRYLAEKSGVTEQAWIGLKDHEIWPEELAAKFRKDDLSVLEGGIPVESDDVSPAPDGSLVYWKSFKFPCTAADGECQIAGISIDVTRDVMREADLENALREKDRLTTQLEASQHMFRSFMENNPNHAWVKDDQGHFVFYNREVSKFFGVSPTEWLGCSVYDIVPQSEADAYLAQDQQVLAGGQNLETIDEVADKDGVLHQLRSVKFSYMDLNGRTMLAKISEDITEQLRQAESLAQAHAQLELVATTDFLTGLYTRRFFSTRAEAEFSEWKRRASPLSLLIMDVDNFKQRNDSYGHVAGDEALTLIGQLLKRCIRVSDTAARMGGEEFAVLLPHTNVTGAMELAKRFQQMLRDEGPGPLPLTVSIGVATTVDADRTWELLLSHADEAMYAAKRTGKDRTVAYTEQATSIFAARPGTRLTA